MTQLEVMKAFMARLANHGYSVSNATATNMLNSAVVASSRFTGIENVIDSMKADQADCEANAIYNVVTTVLGADWYLEKCVNYLTDDNGNFVLDEDNQMQIASFKTLSEIEPLLSTAKKADNSDVTYDDVKDFTAAQSYTSLSNVIKEVTANNFLKNCCGIQLNKNYYISGSTILSAGNSDNTDTGAITGSDANIVYHKKDFTEEKWEEAKTLFPEYYDAVLSEDESTLTIGKGTTKTAEDIVPETWLNTYIATTNQAQKITTGTRDWVVKATAANDTIISGGADSINAGAGDDKINIAGNGATVTAGDGADNISIYADVKKVTITDLTADDTLTIEGSFEVGAAKVEDMMLVITDKTGTRKITLGDFENNAKNGKINLGDASTTIAKWLTDSGINLDNLEKTTYAASVGVTPVTTPETSTSTDAAVETHDVSGTVEVNLKDYLNHAEGNLEVDSKTVGTLSSTFPNASTFTRNGLTVHLLGESSEYAPTTNGTSNITAKTYDQLTADQKAIVAALFKWWGSETLKLNEESYGISFTSDNAKVTDIGLYFYSANSNTLAAVWNWARSSSDGEAYQLMLNVNMNYYSGISSNTDNDAVMNGKSNVKGAGYLDRTLAHEMTHAVMAANVNYFNNLPKFIKEGIAELTHGIDDERGNIIFKNAYDAEQLEASLDMTNTGTGSQEVGDAYAGGYMFLRYFAYQSALQTLAMPAYGEITVDVDLSQLDSLADGNVLYVDTSTTNPTVQVAKDMDAYNATDAANYYNLLNLGSIGADGSGDLYYYVASDWIKQNIKTSANIHDVYGVNANITVTGTGDYDGVQLYEGNTEINTGGGADFVMVSGQYATINTGADNDIVNINEGSHHNINLGEGDNQLLIKGIPSVITTSEGAVSYLNTSSNYGHIITGGAGADTVTNGISVYYLSAKNDDGTYEAYNVADDYIFYLDGSTPVRVTDGSYFDQNKKYYAATGVDENSNINESIEVTPYNFYQYNYEYQMDLGDGDNVVKLSTFENSSLTTGAGNDIIAFTGSDETSNKISSGAGNDSVIFGSLNDNNALNSYTKLNKNYVDLGAGDDTITFGGSYNSIIGGKGNDQITKANDDGDNNVYIYNSDFGTDRISGFTKNDKICIDKGYTATASEVSSGKVTVTVKSGDTEKGTINITLASGATFNADTNIYNSGTASENIEFNVTETGRTIKLTDDVSDVIYIDATKFNDTENLGTLTLDGKFGEDDKIIVYVGNKETNPADVKIEQDGTNALITFTHDNTNYAIKVENAFSDTITLGTEVSADHELTGTYTKTGIASDETNKHILKPTSETKELTLSGVLTTDNISVDGATISVNTSSIYTGNENTGKVTLDTTADITLAVTGEDLGALSAGWTLNEENKVATYSDVSKKGYIVYGKQIKYNNAEEHDKKLTISGIASTEDLTPNETAFTIKAANIGENKTIEIKENTGGYSVNLSNDISNVTINGSANNDTISNSGATVTIDGGAGADEITNSGASVSINGGAGDDKVTISGDSATINVADGNDSITFGSAVTAMTVENFSVGDVLISETDFEMDNVTDTSDGIKIGNATIHGVTKSIVDETWETVSGGFKYTAAATTLQKNSANAKQISYTSSSKNFTISGLKDGAALNKDLTVTEDATSTEFKFKASALNKENVAITTSNGGAFTVALDNDVDTKGETISEDKAISDGVLTYTAAGTGEFYKATANGVTYTPATERPQFTLSGVTSAEGVTVSGNTVTVTDAAFDMTAATSYTVKFENVGTANFALTFNANKNSSATAAKLDNGTYTSAHNSAYFTGSGNEYTFNPAVSAKTFTISNLSAAAKLGENVTVTDGETTKFEFKAAALDKKDIAITSDSKFTVALDSGVTTAGTTISESKTITKGVLNYTAAGTGEYYAATANGVTYTAQVGGETIKISDLNTAETEATGVTVTKTGEAFTIKFTDKDLLNKKNPTITTISKYTVEVDDAVKPTVQAPAWNVRGTKATLRADTSDGYTVKDNAISYSESVAGASEMEISGVVSNAEIDAPTDENKVVTLTAENLRDEASITSNEGNYTVKLTSDMKGKTFTGTSGADTIEVAANNAAVYGGEGVDSIAITGTSVTVDSGAGNDTISIDGSASAMIIFNENSDSDIIQGYKATDTIKVAGSNYDTSESGNDILLSFGGNTLTLKNAKGTELTINKVRTADTFQTGVTVKNNILTASNKFTDDAIDLSEYPETIKKLNASAVENALTITATNTKGTSISGGKGADTIIGSTGNDTLKGNDGADVYIYGGGEDLIYYAEEDKIRLDFEKVESSTLKGSDAVLTLKDNGGTITLKSVKNKTITFVNGENETQKIFFNDTYYAPLEDGLTYNSSRTALTADSVFADTEIDLKNYLNTVTKVNFAAATQGVSITGNTENTANVSITGSAYNDTITGGNGKNVVKGGAGNDEITGGTSDDKLQGEAGDDTLSGGTGKNTLYGGAGKDVFVIGGNDFIYDYNADDDVIRMDFSKLDKSTLSGSNAILTLKDSGGTVTIKSAKNKIITFQDDSGAETQKIFYANTSYDPLENGLSYNYARNKLTADSLFGGYEINLSEYLSTVTKVDASAVTHALTMTGSTDRGVSIKGGTNGDEIIGGDGNDTFKGGEGNDEITGGKGDDRLFGENGNDILHGGEGNDTFKGGEGNDEIHGNAGDNRIFGDAGDDTLYGGTGNSTLTGGAGNDIFVYEGGKDLITDYTAGEEIQLSGSYTITDNYKYSGKNLVFTFDAEDNTLTIKNAKNKEITINGDSKVYEVQKVNAQTYDLLYDNNFVTDEFGLDDITEQKFEVTNIETQNNLEIAQEDKTLITFTGSRQ